MSVSDTKRAKNDEITLPMKRLGKEPMGLTALQQGTRLLLACWGKFESC